MKTKRTSDLTADEALAKILEAEQAAKRAAGRRDADDEDEDKKSDEDREMEEDDTSDDDRAGDDAEECRDDEGADDDRASDDEDDDDEDKKDKDGDDRGATKGTKRAAKPAKAVSQADVRKAAEQAARAAVEADRKRSSGIREIAARFGFPKLGERHAGKSTSVREFKDLILERLAERQKERGTTTFGQRATDGVSDLATGKSPETAQARDYDKGAAEARSLLGK